MDNTKQWIENNFYYAKQNDENRTSLNKDQTRQETAVSTDQKMAASSITITEQLQEVNQVHPTNIKHPPDNSNNPLNYEQYDNNILPMHTLSQPASLYDSPRNMQRVDNATNYPSVPPSYSTGSATDADAPRMLRFQHAVSRFTSTHSSAIARAVVLLLLVAYSVYFGFALRHTVREYGSIRGGTVALLVLTVLSVLMIVYTLVKRAYGEVIYRRALKPASTAMSKTWPLLKWILVPGLFIVSIVFLASIVDDIRQLQSLSGLVGFVLFTYAFSKHPDKIIWRPVLWGFALQFVMGVLVLRWSAGYQSIKFLSDQITTFINYSMAGASAVFGDPFFLVHPFAFVAMPMLIYIGAVMSILYYLGITQAFAVKAGWLFQVSMGTTTIESLAVAANIFLNGMDTILMLRAYLHKLTKSEFHCFLVGNHATVAGFAFAIFVMFGAPPAHLLSAAVMSAPAVIAVAKLSYPETEESTTKSAEDIQIATGDEMNVIEAGANGAAVAGKTVTAVIVSFIGFVSILEFVNVTLGWLGDRVGYPELSFQVVCSYLFFPLALLMGVEWEDARSVGSLVGIKVFTSEVLAYQEMGVMKDNDQLSARSVSIATYALCGFSGLSTLAIAVGVWNTSCPSKLTEMVNQMLRVIVNANISCFMTACVAGLLYDSEVANSTQPPPLEDANLIGDLLNLLPSYKELLALMPG